MTQLRLTSIGKHEKCCQRQASGFRVAIRHKAVRTSWY